jgi:molecular chaperone GrpE
LGILPVLDNFELALKHVPEKEANNNWIIGILHIKKQLEDFLNQNGVEEIETKAGDELDENIHEVLARDEDENEEDLTKNPKIKEVVKRGYRIGERIIRPVVVKI